MVRIILSENAKLGERWKILAIAVGGLLGIGTAFISLTH